MSGKNRIPGLQGRKHQLNVLRSDGDEGAKKNDPWRRRTRQKKTQKKEIHQGSAVKRGEGGFWGPHFKQKDFYNPVKAKITDSIPHGPIAATKNLGSKAKE